MKCPKCGLENPLTRDDCSNCGYDFTGRDLSVVQDVTTTKAVEIEQRFKTLLSYGKVLSAIGWILVLLGIISILIGLVNSDEALIILVGGGILVIIMGFVIVVAGQYTSCFVYIERNTHLSCEYLKKLSDIKQ